MKKICYLITCLSILSLCSCSFSKEARFKKFLDNNDFTTEMIDEMIVIDEITNFDIDTLNIKDTKIKFGSDTYYLWESEDKMYLGMDEGLLYLETDKIDEFIGEINEDINIDVNDLKVSSIIDETLSSLELDYEVSLEKTLNFLNFEYDDFTLVEGSNNRFQVKEESLENAIYNIGRRKIDLNEVDKYGYIHTLDLFFEFDGKHITTIDFIYSSSFNYYKGTLQQTISVSLDFIYDKNTISQFNLDINYFGDSDYNLVDKYTTIHESFENSFNCIISNDNVGFSSKIMKYEKTYSNGEFTNVNVLEEATFNLSFSNAKFVLEYNDIDYQNDLIQSLIANIEFDNDWIKIASIVFLDNNGDLINIGVTTDNVTIPTKYIDNMKYAIDILSILQMNQ